MKKILAIVLSLAMVLSLGVMLVSADTVDGWKAVGEVAADFGGDKVSQLVMDGDVSDWQTAGFTEVTLDKYNFAAWVGSVSDDWKISMYFTSDAKNFYLAFKIYDPEVIANEKGGYQKGDAFQIQLDFNQLCGKTEGFDRAVFYSFGYQEDGVIDMTVQCIYDNNSEIDYVIRSDGELEPTTNDERTDAEFASHKIQGGCKKMEDGSGWMAEIAMPLQMLFNDVKTKLQYGEAYDSSTMDFKFDADHPLILNMLICYLDYGTITADDGSTSVGIVNAIGTFNSNPVGDDGWFPENSGATLKLNGEAEIEVPTEGETTKGEETTVGEVTTKADDTKKNEDTTAAAGETTVAGSSEETTKGSEKKSGCGSVVGGALALIATISLAGVCLKKKD